MRRIYIDRAMAKGKIAIYIYTAHARIIKKRKTGILHIYVHIRPHFKEDFQQTKP
jgi:hypothetical protein